jgi:RNA polymerase sigma-70 factor (ECF subfamily)
VSGPRDELERRFRSSFGRLVAALTRRFGPHRLASIENAVQEACVRALERWRDERVPDDGDAWLLRVAHNHLLDELRREVRETALAQEETGAPDPALPTIDDELCLVFLSCHPTLPRAAQIALTLRVAYGFTTAQIARAFLSDERTIAQRIVRAKQRLRDDGARFELPEPSELPSRLPAMLDVLYQLFTEGYATTTGETGIDDALCQESLRLARMVTDASRLSTPAAEALRALFSFHLARSQARRADDGSLLLLHEQDRSRWDQALIVEGFAYLGRSARGGESSRFHLEAGIAACHAAAASHATTDWLEIAHLYDLLRAVAPSPVVEVNRALAVAHCRGANAGLDELDAIPERDLLARYPYALAAYAELHASLGHLGEARSYLERALTQQSSAPERALLRRKRDALGP